ncbi:MAG: T9SS type A sorting domain-containing protein, partial [Flavobacteriales bacterium]
LVSLTAGNAYFYAIQTQYDVTTGDLELAIKATNETDGDYSNGYWAQSTTDEYMWFFGQGSLTDRTPAVRLVLDMSVNQPEINLPDIQLTLFPNPASHQIQTQMQLDASTYVAWEIRNTEGKLIKFDNIGQFKSGANVFVTPIEELASGNYIIRYVFDGERAVSRSFAVQK